MSTLKLNEENYARTYYGRQKCSKGSKGCIYSNPTTYGTNYHPICQDHFPFPVGPLRAEYFEHKPHVVEPKCSYYSNLKDFGYSFGPNYLDSRYAKKCCQRRATCPFVGVV